MNAHMSDTDILLILIDTNTPRILIGKVLNVFMVECFHDFMVTVPKHAFDHFQEGYRSLLQSG